MNAPLDRDHAALPKPSATSLKDSTMQDHRGSSGYKSPARRDANSKSALPKRCTPLNVTRTPSLWRKSVATISGASSTQRRRN